MSRPSARKVAIWADVRAALDHIKMTEFLLGFQPEKPREIDWEAVQLQLGDARAVLGAVCLALSDEEVEP
ncbi:hypothetical protein [Microbacterium xylanilyticum]